MASAGGRELARLGAEAVDHDDHYHLHEAPQRPGFLTAILAPLWQRRRGYCRLTIVRQLALSDIRTDKSGRHRTAGLRYRSRRYLEARADRKGFSACRCQLPWPILERTSWDRRSSRAPPGCGLARTGLQ